MFYAPSHSSRSAFVFALSCSALPSELQRTQSHSDGSYCKGPTRWEMPQQAQRHQQQIWRARGKAGQLEKSAPMHDNHVLTTAMFSPVYRELRMKEGMASKAQSAGKERDGGGVCIGAQSARRVPGRHTRPGYASSRPGRAVWGIASGMHARACCCMMVVPW